MQGQKFWNERYIKKNILFSWHTNNLRIKFSCLVQKDISRNFPSISLNIICYQQFAVNSNLIKSNIMINIKLPANSDYKSTCILIQPIFFFSLQSCYKKG